MNNKKISEIAKSIKKRQRLERIRNLFKPKAKKKPGAMAQWLNTRKQRLIKYNSK